MSIKIPCYVVEYGNRMAILIFQEILLKCGFPELVTGHFFTHTILSSLANCKPFSSLTDTLNGYSQFSTFLLKKVMVVLLKGAFR